MQKEDRDENTIETHDDITEDATTDSNSENKAQEQAIDYKEKYTRLLAEYSNAMRQKEVELKSMAQFGNKNLLLKVLDIVDDVEMGLAQENISDETKGILEILHTKLLHVLTIEGVVVINLEEGSAYDAETCEVISTFDDAENKGKIVAIARKGYKLKDRVLRTAKVVVAK